MKKLTTIICLFIGLVSFGQGEANYWYFGNYAGITFNTSPPTALTDGQMSTLEGCTTISSSSGELLFYTDGSVIYNKNHQVMQNGTGLKGDESSTSSALIVPQPNSTNIYYVFTVDEPHHFNADNNSSTSDNDGVNDGFMYSVVDMTLDGGNGAVIPAQKNIQLYTYDPDVPLEEAYKCSEKITAVRSDNCSSFWIITHFVDSFYAFEVSEDGINEEPVVSTIGVTVPLSGYRRNSLGYIKASPEGDKIALAHLGLATTMGGDDHGMVALYDFDNATGMVSNELILHDGDSPYGVEFSSSGNRLYASIGIGISGSEDGYVVQYDLTQPQDDIADSAFILENENGQQYTSYNAGALQLGPDGRIYRALFSFISTPNNGDYLGVIKNPEALGAEVEYTESEILVNVDGSRVSQIGLPPFIQSIFSSQIDIINLSDDTTTGLGLCNGDSYTLSYDDIPGATYVWYHNGEILPAETTHQLVINQPSGVELPFNENYRLEVDLNDGSCPLVGVAEITYYSNPELETSLEDENVCEDDEEEGVFFDFTGKSDEILLNLIDSEGFLVKFFASEDDAAASTNELDNFYTTTSYQQEIHVRIEHEENADCYILDSFTIFGFEKPIVNPAEPIVVCEDQDGNQMYFNLVEHVDNVIENSNPQDFEADFYFSLNDAENDENAITQPDNVLLTVDTQGVFFKIKNSENEECFEIVEIPVTINPLPEAFDAQLSQCGVDDAGPVSLFNLTLAETELSGGNQNVTFKYFTNSIDAEIDENEIITPEAFTNVTNPQVITVRVIDNETGCYNTSELTLMLNLTEANDAILIGCDDDGTEDGFYSFNLLDAQVQILDNQPNGLTLSYFETLEDALLENSPLSTTYTNTTANNQTIFARVENDSECFGISEIELIVQNLPALPADEEVIYCTDTFPESIILEAGITGSAYSYYWMPGEEDTSSIEINETGIYTITVTDMETGCQNSRQITVLPSNAATVEEIIVEGVEYDNTVIVILAEGNNGDYEYTLNNSFGPYQNSNIFQNVEPGFHTIFVRDKNGCGITPAEFSIIGFPKFFTPNADGFNDTWQVIGVQELNVNNCEIYVFDRYGKLLAQLDPSSPGWDGIYNGNNMPSNDYWYRVVFSDGRIFRGHFTLKR